MQGLSFAEPGFRGCAFVGASAEAQPGSTIEAAADDYRVWVRTLFLDLARDAGAAQPESRAQQLTAVAAVLVAAAIPA